jgi:hypothetical protein
MVEYAGVILTFAAEAKWVLEDELACHRAELEDKIKRVEMADEDLKQFIAAAVAKGVNPAPFISRREICLFPHLALSHWACTQCPL